MGGFISDCPKSRTLMIRNTYRECAGRARMIVAQYLVQTALAQARQQVYDHGCDCDSRLVGSPGRHLSLSISCRDASINNCVLHLMKLEQCVFVSNGIGVV
jgi:hypothetical protein